MRNMKKSTGHTSVSANNLRPIKNKVDDSSSDGFNDQTNQLVLPIEPQTLMGILKTGFTIGKTNFFGIFPFTFVFAILAIMLPIFQPSLQFALYDGTDWLALGLFIFSSLAIAGVHASIVYRLKLFAEGHDSSFTAAVSQGLKKGLPIYLLCILICAIVVLGLALLILPGIYAIVLFSLATFLFVVNDRSSNYQPSPSHNQRLGTQNYQSNQNYQNKTDNEKKTGNQNMNKNRNQFILKRIASAIAESYRLVKGNWWKTAIVFFSIALVTFISESVCQKLLIDQIVLSSLLCVTLRALFLTVWYGCMMALLFDLKARSKETKGSSLQSTN